MIISSTRGPISHLASDRILDALRYTCILATQIGVHIDAFINVPVAVHCFKSIQFLLEHRPAEVSVDYFQIRLCENEY